MSCRLGLDEHRDHALADHRLRVEHLEWQLPFCRGFVEGQVLVREGFYEVKCNFSRRVLVGTDMDLDVVWPTIWI